jgi:hypothetical protein
MSSLKTWTVYAVDMKSLKSLQLRQRSSVVLSGGASLPVQSERFELTTPKGRVKGTCRLPLRSTHFESAMKRNGGHLVFEGTEPGIRVFACDLRGRKYADFSEHFSYRASCRPYFSFF